MSKTTLSILAALALAAACFSDGILKITSGPGSYLSPIQTRISVDINTQVALTTTRQTFVNTQAESVAVKYCFPLGMSASVSAIAWEKDSLRYQGKIKVGAQDSSTTGGSGSPDAALAAYLGKSPFFFPLPGKIGPGKEVVMELSYIELLGYKSGTVSYLYPFATPATFTSGTVELFEADIVLSSQRTITSMGSATWTGGTTVLTDSRATYFLRVSNPPSGSDFNLQYTLDASDLGLFMLSYQPDTGDGYFLMVAEPDPATSQQQILDKVFTFVIDRSGSMGGTKIEQAKLAARYCVQNLNPEDRFNIVIFDDVIETFRPAPVPANASNIAAALSYVDQVTARNMTDINNALLTALSQYQADTTSNIIIFLTDGAPTSGVTGTDAILANIRAANTGNVRIFPFGIGAGVSNTLLSQLALQNNGTADFLDNTEISQRISAFYQRIKDPVIQNISLSFSAGDVSGADLLPLNIPDIFLGEQLIVAGRYRVPGATTVTLSGDNTAGPVSYAYSTVFTDSAENAFVAKIWAKMRIDALMSLIYKEGETSLLGQEYKAEVIRLSLEYGIQTKYTSYEDDGNPGPITETEGKTTVAGHSGNLCAYPNPFNPDTRIVFSAAGLRDGEIALMIYSVDGKLVRVIRGCLRNGRVVFQWDGRNGLGLKLCSGVYVGRIRANGKTAEIKLFLAK